MPVLLKTGIFFIQAMSSCVYLLIATLKCMNKILACLLLASFPLLVTAQKSFWTDSTNKIILEEDCHGYLFEKTEEPPSLKISLQSFSDSLTSYLLARKVKLKKQTITFSFIVTSKSQLLDLRKVAGDAQKENIYGDAIVHYADLWTPAKQNSKVVCCYVKLTLITIDKKISTTIERYR